MCHLRRWWHCATRLHRAVTYSLESGRVVYLGCECGAECYISDEAARARSKLLADTDG